MVKIHSCLSLECNFNVVALLQVGFLILGVGLLDFCGQVCFTLLEALLSDLYRDEEDCGQAFAMFSFMVSLGGCVGYLLPALDWSRGLLSVYLGGQAECLFSLLILIFISSVLITMKVSEEPLCVSTGLAGSGSLLESGAGTMEAGRCGVPRSCCYLLKCKLRLLKSGPLLCLLRTCWSMTPTIYRSYCHVPRVMRQLCVAQLCSWMAVMSFVFFYTDFVGEGLYDGLPSALPGSLSRQRYDEGQTSSLYAVYCVHFWGYMSFLYLQTTSLADCGIHPRYYVMLHYTSPTFCHHQLDLCTELA